MSCYWNISTDVVPLEYFNRYRAGISQQISCCWNNSTDIVQLVYLNRYRATGLLQCALCWCFIFFENVVLRSCTANCGTSSIFMSQMAVGFWNAIRTDVPLGVFIVNVKESSFSSFCPVSRNAFWVCLVYGLLGLNAVIILPLYCNAIIVWSLEMFCLVSQAFYYYVGKKGYSFCSWMYWVPLWWFVNSTLSCPTPFSLFIAMWLISEDAGYDWVGGDVTECIVYMFRAMTL